VEVDVRPAISKTPRRKNVIAMKGQIGKLISKRGRVDRDTIEEHAKKKCREERGNRRTSGGESRRKTTLLKGENRNIKAKYRRTS